MLNDTPKTEGPVLVLEVLLFTTECDLKMEEMFAGEQKKRDSWAYTLPRLCAGRLAEGGVRWLAEKEQGGSQDDKFDVQSRVLTHAGANRPTMGSHRKRASNVDDDGRRRAWPGSVWADSEVEKRGGGRRGGLERTVWM